MLTPLEQYFVELLNRARANPGGEAARFGIAVDEGLPPGTVSEDPLQPLAVSPELYAAADAHSADMLANDFFNHTNLDGVGATDRMFDAGWSEEPGSGWATGENISFHRGYGDVTEPSGVERHHEGLFLSSGHRANILKPRFSEVGVGLETDGETSYATQNFADGGRTFITGVAIEDLDGDDFYDVGEGLSEVSVTISGGGFFNAVTTASAGGYSVEVPEDGSFTLTFDHSSWTESIVETVDVSGENVKVDAIVDSAGSGGDGGMALNGTAGRDVIVGTEGSDTIHGGAGDDTVWAGADDAGHDEIHGQGGNDVLGGGPGNDTVSGGPGTDVLYGGPGSDQLDGSGTGAPDIGWAGPGDDVVLGGDGDDILGGGDGADEILAGGGGDVLYGGGDGQSDTLLGGNGDDTIYGGGGVDTIEGGAGDDMVFNGPGNDRVEGGDGVDTLWGGPGDDALFGQGGADVYAFGSSNGTDTIAFDAADGDSINISVPFDEVVIGQDPAGSATVSFGQTTIILTGIAPSDVDAGWFI